MTIIERSPLDRRLGPSRSEARRALVLVLLAAVGAAAVLWWAGRGLPMPPLTDAERLLRWTGHHGAITAVIVMARWITLAGLAWVGLTTAFALAASVSGLEVAGALAQRCVLPSLRPLAGAALGVSVTLASFGPTAAPAVAQGPTTGDLPPTLVLVDPPATTATTSPGDPPELILLDPEPVVTTSSTPPAADPLPAPPSPAAPTTAGEPDEPPSPPTVPAPAATPLPPTSDAVVDLDERPTPPPNATTRLPAAGDVAGGPAPTGPATPAPIPGSSLNDGPGESRTAASITSWIIEPGEHLWLVAEQTVIAAHGVDADLALVADYHQLLIAANRSRLPVPADPDLVFPGMEVLLPAVPLASP